MVSAAHVLSQVLRERVVKHMLAVGPAIAPRLVAVVAQNPSMTAAEILTRPDVLAVINRAVSSARAQVSSELRAGFSAANLLGEQVARSEFAQLGEDLPEVEIGPPSAYLESILVDVQRMTQELAEDLGARMSHIFVSTQVPSDAQDAARALGEARAARVPYAVERATRRLAARARASASVLAVRTVADTKLAYYLAFEEQHPGMRLFKRWQTTSAKPCPACVALNGATVPLGSEFDRFLAATPDFTLPRVYFDLQNPPRHPNCRCILVLVVEPEDQELLQTMNRPVEYTMMTAAQVREMPLAKYRAFTSFLRSTLKVVRRIFQRKRHG